MAKQRRPVNGDYSAKLRAIRAYVDFDYDLRHKLPSAAKRKINRYAAALQEISARSNVVYRGRDIKRVREVQKLSRNEFDNLPGFRVAFVESPPANPVKVRITKRGKARLVARHFALDYIPFNAKRLAQSPEDETKRAMAQSPARWFRISTGKFSIATAYDRNVLPAEVGKLVARYDTDAKDPTKVVAGKSINHHYSRWLNGLISLEVRNQTDLEEFLRKDAKARDARAEQRKRQRRKIRRDKAKTDNGM